MTTIRKYRVLKIWDDLLAEYRYKLQVENDYQTGYDDLDYEGNLEWAKRQVEHYECKIVENS